MASVDLVVVGILLVLLLVILFLFFLLRRTILGFREGFEEDR